MLCKVNVSVVMLVEVDDEYAELAENYPSDDWDAGLADEMVAEVKEKTGLRTWDEIDPDCDIGVPHITSIYNMENEPMTEF